MNEYTENDIVVMVNNFIAKNSPELLYKQGFVNYRGKTKDTGEYYTEVIARELINKDFVGQLRKIAPINRKNYNAGHSPNTKCMNIQSNRIEENIAIALYSASNIFGITFGRLGQIIDYQVPLKATRKNAGVGKIDLISKTKDEIWLIELKYYKSKDKQSSRNTLLKAALEIATYYQQLNKKNFINSYEEFSGYRQDQIRKAVLIFDEDNINEEYLQLKSCNMPLLKHLLKRLDVSIFVISITGI